MDYSIVIPVFNREDLTQQCLATLRPTLAGAGDGEVIVVDNGSRAATAAVLAAFPWVRVIRNEHNLGFAAACNQGARAATGRAVCHLNNDIVATSGWLAAMMRRLVPGVGIVGARLFFPNDTVQHAGVGILPTRFGPEGIGPYHVYWKWPRTTPAADVGADFEVVTGACLLTPRDLFLSLGGFDEAYWNGYEDVDYCLNVRANGLRVVYEPAATLYHYESQSGVQRKRRLPLNLRTLGTRWGERVRPDHNRYWAPSGIVRRETIGQEGRGFASVPLPKTTIVVHGPPPDAPERLADMLALAGAAYGEVLWLAQGPPPPGAVIPGGDDRTPVDKLADLFESRHDRYLAFVDTRTRLRANWLSELALEIEYGSEVVAATVVGAAEHSADVEPSACDGRCSLLNLRNVPKHLRFGVVTTIDAALVDFSRQAVRHGLGVRRVRSDIADLGAPVDDPVFAARAGEWHHELRRPTPERLEAACAPAEAAATFASIVMLSWNAPQYTKLAVESIRALTRTPYEIIIVDNGSGPATLAVLAELGDVTIIYNATNMGFAHGCNQGISAARGTHVVLLNNDVVVTAGWLENLLAAHRRDPLVGVSAPRSNRVVGHQMLDVRYETLDEMHALAAQRTRDFAGMHYRTQRAIGFCLCISRAVVEEVGGIDTRYGVGNFEDDDFCIRVRAAGYQIVVCEDVFIHHFGSISFAANNVDYMSQMRDNWKIFAQRWRLPPDYPAAGYNALSAIALGFEPQRDYVGLNEPAAPAARAVAADEPRRAYETAFVAVVDGDAAWSRIGPIVTNYIKALHVGDPTVFSIAAVGELDAVTIGGRIARSIDKLKLDRTRVADVDVADVRAVDEWLAAIPAATRLRVANDERLAELTLVGDRSPSGISRVARGVDR